MNEQIKKEAWRHGISTLREIKQSSDEARIDEIAVDSIACAMKLKLSEKREEGRGGWHSSRVISVESLEAMVREHVERGDWLDVMNLVMMLCYRTEEESR